MSTVLPQQNEIIIKPFVYGSVAFSLGKKSNEDISHKWCVYVRGVNNENISNFVKEVHFILHTTFQNHIRKVDKWPFELYEVGWGEFDIKIKIFLIDETMKPLEVVHSLKRYPSQSDINLASRRPVVSENYDEIIFTAPDGERFDQKAANSLSLKENIIILCGHYKGVDQRVRDHLITREYSIGDFVLTGGEMPAAMMTDAIVRLLPGALGDVESALNDSFQDGLLEAGVYTRPAEYKGWKVPEILLSGHQAKIEEWNYEQSLAHTKERRPDLLEEN